MMKKYIEESQHSSLGNNIDVIEESPLEPLVGSLENTLMPQIFDHFNTPGHSTSVDKFKIVEGRIRTSEEW